MMLRMGVFRRISDGAKRRRRRGEANVPFRHHQVVLLLLLLVLGLLLAPAGGKSNDEDLIEELPVAAAKEGYAAFTSSFTSSLASVMGFRGGKGRQQEGAISSAASFVQDLFGDGYSLPVMLTPPELIFKDTPICIPAVALIDVVNKSPKEELHLLGITANHPHFYPAMFKAQILSPHGTTTIQITFLPQAVGAIRTSLTISTSQGDIPYLIRANSIPNVYRLAPVVGSKIPAGVPNERPIVLYNPHDEVLNVREVFTTESFLNIVIPSDNDEANFAGGMGTSQKIGGGSSGDSGREDDGPFAAFQKKRSYKKKGSSITRGEWLEENQSGWAIPPHQEKEIVDLSFRLPFSGRYQAYMHIKTDRDNMVIPIELNVVKGGVYPNVKEVDFGILTSAEEIHEVDVSLFNSGSKPIKILEVSESTPDPLLSIHFIEDTVLQPGVDTSDIVTLEYWGQEPGEFEGRIVLITNHTNPALATVEITYKAQVLHGGLGYNWKDYAFLLLDVPIDPRESSTAATVFPAGAKNKTTQRETESSIIQMVQFTNLFPTNLSLKTVKMQDCANAMRVIDYPQGIVAEQQERWPGVILELLPDLFREHYSVPHVCSLTIITNISHHVIPIYVHNNRLQPKDGTPFGAAPKVRNSTGQTVVHPQASKACSFDFYGNPLLSVQIEELGPTTQGVVLEGRMLGLGTSKTFTLAITNFNPVPLNLQAPSLKSSRSRLKYKFMGQHLSEKAPRPIIDAYLFELHDTAIKEQTADTYDVETELVSSPIYLDVSSMERLGGKGLRSHVKTTMGAEIGGRAGSGGGESRKKWKRKTQEKVRRNHRKKGGRGRGGRDKRERPVFTMLIPKTLKKDALLNAVCGMGGLWSCGNSKWRESVESRHKRGVVRQRVAYANGGKRRSRAGVDVFGWDEIEGMALETSPYFRIDSRRNQNISYFDEVVAENRLKKPNQWTIGIGHTALFNVTVKAPTTEESIELLKDGPVFGLRLEGLKFTTEAETLNIAVRMLVSDGTVALNSKDIYFGSYYPGLVAEAEIRASNNMSGTVRLCSLESSLHFLKTELEVSSLPAGAEDVRIGVVRIVEPNCKQGKKKKSVWDALHDIIKGSDKEGGLVPVLDWAPPNSPRPDPQGPGSMPDIAVAGIRRSAWQEIVAKGGNQFISSVTLKTSAEITSTVRVVAEIVAPSVVAHKTVTSFPLASVGQVMGKYISVVNPYPDRPLEVSVTLGEKEWTEFVWKEPAHQKKTKGERTISWWDVELETLREERAPVIGGSMDDDEVENIAIYVDPQSKEIHQGIAVTDPDCQVGWVPPLEGTLFPFLDPSYWQGKKLDDACLPPASFRVDQTVLEPFVLAPQAKALVGPVLFRPAYPGNFSMTLQVWNNVTGIEAVRIEALGGQATLRVEDLQGHYLGGLGEHVLQSPLSFNVRAAEVKGDGKEKWGSPYVTSAYQSIRLRNTGDMPLKVNGMTIDGEGCGGFKSGFVVVGCTEKADGVWLEPDVWTEYSLRYDSPCISARHFATLAIQTSMGVASAELEAHIPIETLRYCEQVQAEESAGIVLELLRSAVGLLALLVAFGSARDVFKRSRVILLGDSKCLNEVDREASLLPVKNATEENEKIVEGEGNVEEEDGSSISEEEDEDVEEEEEEEENNDENAGPIASGCAVRASSLLKGKKVLLTSLGKEMVRKSSDLRVCAENKVLNSTSQNELVKSSNKPLEPGMVKDLTSKNEQQQCGDDAAADSRSSNTTSPKGKLHETQSLNSPALDTAATGAEAGATSAPPSFSTVKEVELLPSWTAGSVVVENTDEDMTKFEGIDSHEESKAAVDLSSQPAVSKLPEQAEQRSTPCGSKGAASGGSETGGKGVEIASAIKHGRPNDNKAASGSSSIGKNSTNRDYSKLGSSGSDTNRDGSQPTTTNRQLQQIKHLSIKSPTSSPGIQTQRSSSSSNARVGGRSSFSLSSGAGARRAFSPLSQERIRPISPAVLSSPGGCPRNRGGGGGSKGSSSPLATFSSSTASHLTSPPTTTTSYAEILQQPEASVSSLSSLTHRITNRDSPNMLIGSSKATTTQQQQQSSSATEKSSLSKASGAPRNNPSTSSRSLALDTKPTTLSSAAEIVGGPAPFRLPSPKFGASSSSPSQPPAPAFSSPSIRPLSMVSSAAVVDLNEASQLTAAAMVAAVVGDDFTQAEEEGKNGSMFAASSTSSSSTTRMNMASSSEVEGSEKWLIRAAQQQQQQQAAAGTVPSSSSSSSSSMWRDLIGQGGGQAQRTAAVGGGVAPSSTGSNSFTYGASSATTSLFGTSPFSSSSSLFSNAVFFSSSSTNGSSSSVPPSSNPTTAANLATSLSTLSSMRLEEKSNSSTATTAGGSASQQHQPPSPPTLPPSSLGLNVNSTPFKPSSHQQSRIAAASASFFGQRSSRGSAEAVEGGRKNGNNKDKDKRKWLSSMNFSPARR